ncbi:MAG: hypothetical protein JST35_07105 [Armatimonadetes bacterium]|nr:hypothetical protein [Armatimonadota bacterium]
MKKTLMITGLVTSAVLCLAQGGTSKTDASGKMSCRFVAAPKTQTMDANTNMGKITITMYLAVSDKFLQVVAWNKVPQKIAANKRAEVLDSAFKGYLAKQTGGVAGKARSISLGNASGREYTYTMTTQGKTLKGLWRGFISDTRMYQVIGTDLTGADPMKSMGSYLNSFSILP